MRDLDRFGNRWQQNGPHSMQATFTGNNSQIALTSGALFTNNATVEFASDGGGGAQGFVYVSGTTSTVNNTGTTRTDAIR